MNDRFRFRVWDKENHILHILQDGKKYDCDSVEIAFDGSLIGTSFNDEIERKEHSIAYLGGENCVLEQCTGLKDKNGKLIYEGDIVKEKDEEPMAVIKFGICRGYQCFFPEWFSPYAKATKYSLGFRQDLNYWLKEGIEVIGNIHENPELLEPVTNCNQ